MAGVAGFRYPACGHPVPPDARFCPVCGQPAAAADRAAPSNPSTAPMPATPPLPQQEPPPWDSWYVPRLPPPPDGPDATRPDGLGPASSGDAPTAMLGNLRLAPLRDGPLRDGPLRDGPLRDGLLRPRRSLVLAIAAVALVAVVTGVVVFRGHSNSSTASGARAAGATPTASSHDDRRQAAARLSGLLARSVTDRIAVIDAVADVRRCGSSLRQDARTFARAAGSRQRLLSSLGSMPGLSLLPAAMLRDLTGAWQASAQADTDLVRWANGKIARGCHKHSGSDASLRASYVPDGQATAGKKAFASLWNPVARQYGLTTYRWSQLLAERSRAAGPYLKWASNGCTVLSAVAVRGVRRQTNQGGPAVRKLSGPDAGGFTSGDGDDLSFNWVYVRLASE